MSALEAAAETITTAELTRHLQALAADSLRRRTTPGPDAYAFTRYGATSLALAPARTQAEPARAHVGETVTGIVLAVRFAFYLGQELANSRTRPQ